MAVRSSPGGFVVATVTNPGSFMATITHPTGNGYCRDRILRDRSSTTRCGRHLAILHACMINNMASVPMTSNSKKGRVTN